MVIAAEDDDPRLRERTGFPEKLNALSPSRRAMSQSRLYNFFFPTSSWGNQNLLRCVFLSGGSVAEKIHPSTRRSTSSSPDRYLSPPSWPTLPPPRLSGRKRGAEDVEKVEDPNLVGASGARPWNLRSRSAACIDPGEIGRNRNPSSSSSPSPSLSHSPLQKQKINNQINVVRPRSEGLEMGLKGERRKISVALSREEIEEDFLVLKGANPPRRPKKRVKCLQKQLDAIFPGLLLSVITVDRYKTEEIGS